METIEKSNSTHCTRTCTCVGGGWHDPSWGSDGEDEDGGVRPIPLTAPYLEFWRKKRCRSSSSSCCSSSSRTTTTSPTHEPEQDDTVRTKQMLEEQLSRRGWCVVTLDANWSSCCHNAAGDDPEHAIVTERLATMLQNHAQWKDWQEDILFSAVAPPEEPTAAADDPKEDDATRSNNQQHQQPQPHAPLQWIPSESGDPHAPTVEAKQSWELQRRHCAAITTATTDTTTDTTTTSATNSEPESSRCAAQRQQQRLLLMKDWLQLLHHVVVTIVRVLELPQDVLYLEEEEEFDENTVDSTGNIPQPPAPQPLDLLRLFRYDVVVVPDSNTSSSTTTTTTTTTLGSSPHTDWGSWTVVWSDEDPHSVQGGCLQTYCRGCRQWNPVRVVAPTTTTTRKDKDHTAAHNPVYFIVHVGDATSLALNGALQRRRQQQQQQQRTGAAAVVPEDSPTTTTTTATTTAVELWPSPRHRVVSPTQTVRHSLVYFAYPPPDSTLQQITDQLLLLLLLLSEQGSHHSHPGCSYNKNNRRIPYTDYSLLQDQSPHPHPDDDADDDCGSGRTCWPMEEEKAAQRRWEALLHQPVRQVVQDKWNQVQRRPGIDDDVTDPVVTATLPEASIGRNS